MIELYFKRRGAPAEKIRLPLKSVIVGRREGVDWVLDYPDVSRRQCRIYVEGRRIVVEPLGATNPVLLNDRVIEGPTTFGPEDELSFGDCRVRLAAGAREVAQVMAPLQPSNHPVTPDLAAERPGPTAATATAPTEGEAVSPEAEWIREAARRWEALEYPDRLLLRGVQLQRASERLKVARRGMDARLVQHYFDRSVESRRNRSLTAIASAFTTVIAGIAGVAVARAFDGPPVDIPSPAPTDVCVLTKLSEARSLVESAADLNEGGRLLATAYAMKVAEESHCRDALEIERSLRDLLGGHANVMLRGPAGPAAVIARAPDDRTVAIADAEAVRIYALAGGPDAVELSDSGAAVALAWSGNSRWLATGDRDGTVNLRDAQQKPIYAIAHTLPRHQAMITQIAFSPDGNWLASGDAKGEVRLWSMSGTEIGESKGSQLRPGEVKDLIFDSRGGRLFARTGETVTLWSIDRARGRSALGRGKTLAGDVTALDVRSDGSAMITGHRGGQVKLWGAERAGGSLSARSIYGGSGSSITAVSFVPGRDEVIFATNEPQLAIIDLKARLKKDVYALVEFRSPLSPPTDLAVDSTGTRAVTVEERASEIWEIAERLKDPVDTPLAPEGGWTAVDLPSRGGLVLFGEPDGVVRGHDIFAGSGSGAAYSLGLNHISTIMLDGAGDTLVTQGQDDETILRTWSLGEYGRPELPRRLEVARKADVIAVSKDGRVVAGAADDQIWVWDLGLKVQKPVELSLPGVERLSFAAEGLALVAAGPDRLRRWRIAGTRPDPASGEDIPIEGRIFALAASDTHIAAGVGTVERGLVLAWELLDLQHRVIEEKMARPVDLVAFDASGEHLAASSKDNAVKSWRLSKATAREAQAFTADSRVTALALSPGGDETWAAIGTNLGTVSTWSLSGPERETWRGHEVQINGIAFGPSADMLITADHEGVVTKWVRAGGEWSKESPLTIARVPRGILQLTAASGGNAVVDLGGDGSVQIWPVDGTSLLERACSLVGWRELDDTMWRSLKTTPVSLCQGKR